MSITVTTQTELDAALAAGEATIYIQSDPGVWLRIAKTGSSRVEAWGSSHVVASGSSHVEAWGSSHVEALESSHVEAWGSSHVEAWGSSHVEAWESSTVEARGSSRVVAWESSRVVASGSSRVVAWGSSTVEARGSSHVEAWESSHVVAWESCNVEAGPYVAVHLHSRRVTLSGGVVIDMTAVDETDPQTWCDLHGAAVDKRGNVTLYKALGDDLVSGQSHKPITWPTRGKVACADFEATNACGHGLHLGPTIGHATDYRRDATRWLKVRAKLADLVPVTGSTAKCKVPTCTVVGEVDRWGKAVTS